MWKQRIIAVILLLALAGGIGFLVYQNRNEQKTKDISVRTRFIRRNPFSL
jgi:lipopolysaccharide export system protein LptC